MSKILTGLVVIAIAIFAGVFLFHGSGTGSTVSETTKVFNITGDHLRFWMDGVENPEMKVNAGDRVVINFQSTEGFHNWVLDEFGAKTQSISGAQVSTIEFLADKKGTFEYYCSVGQHRANGMHGVFTVQ